MESHGKIPATVVDFLNMHPPHAQPPQHRHDSSHPTPDAPTQSDPLPDTYILDRESVRKIDQTAINDIGIPGMVLMENASLGLAEEALDMLADQVCDQPHVLIICGGGNNGGDGWALARHLHNAGVTPIIVPLSEPKPEGDAGINCAISRKMKLQEISADQYTTCTDVHLIVDAIFGTGLDRPITGPAADAINWINETECPVLAVDIPSGLDCDTGKPLGIAVQADRTVTFVGLKPGFLELDAQPYVGDIVVADIGVPIDLVRQYGQPVMSIPPDDSPSGTKQPPAPSR